MLQLWPKRTSSEVMPPDQKGSKTKGKSGSSRNGTTGRCPHEGSINDSTTEERKEPKGKLPATLNDLQSDDLNTDEPDQADELYHSKEEEVGARRF